VQLDPEVKAAFDVAFENIKCFHAAQQKNQHLQVETMPVGAFRSLYFFLCFWLVHNNCILVIETVGQYGGNAGYLPSTGGFFN